jgi:hypothetical protein
MHRRPTSLYKGLDLRTHARVVPAHVWWWNTPFVTEYREQYWARFLLLELSDSAWLVLEDF